MRALVQELLGRGDGVVITAGAEPLSPGPPSLPLLFDWTVLETVAQSLAQQETDASQQCLILTAPQSEISRIPEHRRGLYRSLQENKRVRLEYLSDETYTGETIRRRLLAAADAIITIGGGKGVSVIAAGREKRPVLPLDCPIGANLNDGEGSVALRRDAIKEPDRLFSYLPDALREALPRVTLRDPAAPVHAIAKIALDVLREELTERDRITARRRPPPTLQETPVLHASVTQAELNRARIEPWVSLPDSESLYKIDKLAGPEIDEIRRRLQRHGICRIRFAGQNPEQAIIDALGRHFGNVLDEQNDHQGMVKEIVPKKGEAATSGNSAGRLGPHVDGTQNARQPALLIFQYVRNADYGSDSTFWDLSQVLLELAPEARQALLAAFAHPEAGHFGKRGLTFTGPMAVRTAQNTVMIRERFDEVIDVHPTAQEFHRYLTNRLKQPGMIYAPYRGDIVIFDNGRILHGREEVGGDPSVRLHRRMWIEDLRPELQSEMLLGIRPIEPAALALLPPRP